MTTPRSEQKKKAQIATKALMSRNLGMIVWLLILGGLALGKLFNPEDI